MKIKFWEEGQELFTAVHSAKSKFKSKKAVDKVDVVVQPVTIVDQPQATSVETSLATSRLEDLTSLANVDDVIQSIASEIRLEHPSSEPQEICQSVDAPSEDFQESTNLGDIFTEATAPVYVKIVSEAEDEEDEDLLADESNFRSPTVEERNVLFRDCPRANF